MMMRILFSILCLLLIVSAAGAQSSGAGDPPVEEQNETMLDTLKRMQIKREENEHKKLLEKGEQIKLDAETLTKQAGAGFLPREGEKKLREIDKAARQIRSEFGGAGDDKPLEPLPANLDITLKQLGDASERLNKHLSKTSRRVISVSVVEVATEITQLVKILRGYLR
ncbi:MAG TPA: hypothetical protein VJ810_13405 [Blastocatellia bacterium]|nr:hypothetical protein [Blastocatellia bacterium]